MSFLFMLSCSDNSKATNNGNTISDKQSVANANAQKAAENAPVAKTTIDDPVFGGPADIEIKLEGAPNGQSLLIGFYAESHFKLDSSKIENGNIRFTKEEGYPQGIYYVSTPSNEFIQIVLGEDQKFKMSTKVGSLVGSMKVTGSTENEIYYQTQQYENKFNAKFKIIKDELSALQAGTAAYQQKDKEKKAFEAERMTYLNAIFKKNPQLLFTKFKQAGQNPIIRENATDAEKVYFYRKEFWDNVDFSDTRLMRTPVISNKLNRYIKELTPQNHDSITSASNDLINQVLNYPEYFKLFTNWIAIQYEPTKCTLMDPEFVFVNLVQNYFTKERAFWADSMEVYALQNRAMEMSQSVLGKKGPNVVSTAPDGTEKAIYDSKADYIIVYLYNPTCEHCMIQTPLLVEWYNTWKDKGRDVYAIAIDTERDEWVKYVKEKNMNFTNVFDPTNRSIYAKYYVDITPEVYVLNKERTIIGKNLKVDQINTIIDRDMAKR